MSFCKSDATFSGGQVNFDGATFSGGEVGFGGATFSGGAVDMSAPMVWWCPPTGLDVISEGGL
jgi:hypothetical protein